MVHHERDYAITNASIYIEGMLSPRTTVVVEQGIITYVGKYDHLVIKDRKVFDAKGRLVGPGLVDMHIHGAGGFAPTRINTQESLEGLALFLLQRGITSFQLAVVMDLDLLVQINEALERSPFLASHLLGVYVEGPFIAVEKKGGIAASSIRAFDRHYLTEILAIKHGDAPLVRTMTIAPELPGSEELSDTLKEHKVVVAYGHSDCDLTALHPKEKNHLTHLFNAMSPIDHKRPGLAAMPFVRSFSHTTYELVCDGVHVSPSVIDLTINTLGTSRLCLISDAMSLAGMGEDEGMYLGKDIYSDGKACYYADNDLLIGSALLINESAKRLYQEGLLDKQSFFSVTSGNPLRVLEQNDRGVVEPGYRADLVIFAAAMDSEEVFKANP